MSSVTIAELEIRRAERSDADAMAEAHRDSIQSIGPAFYPPHDVDAWKDGLRGAVYLNAMEGGEVFFIATGKVDGARMILGFASDYRVEGATHGTSVYVRGIAARHGVSSHVIPQSLCQICSDCAGEGIADR